MSSAVNAVIAAYPPTATPAATNNDFQSPNNALPIANATLNAFCPTLPLLVAAVLPICARVAALVAIFFKLVYLVDKTVIKADCFCIALPIEVAAFKAD